MTSRSRLDLVEAEVPQACSLNKGHDWPRAKHCSICGGMGRVSPVLLAPLEWRSRHVFVAANGPSKPLRLRAEHRHLQPSQDRTLSRWHSLPQGTGTFLAATLGANSPSVRCEAVLPLPPALQTLTRPC